MCAKPSEWITSVGTSHVGYSHGGREKRKKIISYTAQWINNNSSSPAGRVSKKGRDIKNMKRQCASSVHITSIIIVLHNCCAKAGGKRECKRGRINLIGALTHTLWERLHIKMPWDHKYLYSSGAIHEAFSYMSWNFILRLKPSSVLKPRNT